MKYVGILIALTGLTLLAVGCGGNAPATPDETGTLNIIQEEFNFTPDNIELKVGQKVRIVLTNIGKQDHEFMVGRNVIMPEGFPDGFEIEFFHGVEVKVIGPAKMVMGGEAILTREEGMDMDMDMEEKEGMGMDMDMEEKEGMGMDMDMDMDMDMEEKEGMGMDMDMEEVEHHGFMIVQEPSSEATIIEFIVPDKVGEWEFGCFQDDGADYDEGMRGKLVVVAS